MNEQSRWNVPKAIELKIIGLALKKVKIKS